jgi:SAM-dependent methyltransferase
VEGKSTLNTQAMVKTQTKSKQRVADHGEVFTAEREVNAMLDLVRQETERLDSRFLEPACGTGNFLIEILRRKLDVVKSRYKGNPDDYEHYAVIAVSSIYGVDLLQDKVDECRSRLFQIFSLEHSNVCKKDENDEIYEAVRHILNHNILCGDALTLKASNNEPIIFSEWSAVNGCLIKRRDFRLDQMLEGHEIQFTLEMDNCEYEEDVKAKIPLAIREFPPVHYKMLGREEC